ncbi:MAG: rod shape-determining protein MreC [Thermoanaerobaculia bacterium]
MSERRAFWLLLAVSIAQFLGLAAQVPGDERGSGLVHRLAIRLVAPLGGVVEGGAGWLDDLGERLTTRSRLEAENRRLAEQNRVLRRESLEHRDVAHRAELLAEAVRYAGGLNGTLRVADIVYIDHTSWLQSALLAVEEGTVRKYQPVATPDGLLGRVLEASDRWAKVQLITDRSSKVGAMVERTRRQGLVRGTGGGGLQLLFIPLQADLAIGDRVVTAGIDGIYPRGLPVGTITSVEPGDDLFYRVEVAPAVDFTRLEQAYLIDLPQLPGELLETAPGETQ